MSESRDERLQNRAAIVTGGAQGLGGACARRLARAGASVVIVDIDEELATSNAESINASGGTGSVHIGDVSQEATAKAMVEAAVSRHGRLDILVQNAFGIGSGTFGGNAEEVPAEDWRAGMALLVGALYLGPKYAVPAMESSGPPPGYDDSHLCAHGLPRPKSAAPSEVGRIVNMSSVHGLLQAAGVMTYDAGKAAVIGLTRQMAIEYGPRGITVNAIAPGHMITEKLQQMWQEEANEAGYHLFELQYPVRRTGIPDDIAHAVAFLCSQEASFINGICLPVDGGHSIQLQENLVMEVVDYIRENPDIKTHFDSWGKGRERR
ncbi:MAG: SDR family oxidoreductase [Candidatus Latescibacterota bacterium]|nr:SDR family oxidoreductase [Candidatus Latescibacterota bacterium]